jgi:murein DD-endopeptidase MepM/ murein hydrolase activator NlpD
MRILCPLQNGATFNLNWIQTKPVVTQKFGADFLLKGKYYYKSLGLKGHNGIDFRAAVGVPVFASFNGVIKVGNDGNTGYGLHIKLRGEEVALEAVYAHLSKILFKTGSRVTMGDLIGFTGISGASTGPHLHFGVRILQPSNKDIWSWNVKNYNNGFYGYVDNLADLITWRGGLEVNVLG